MKRDFPKLVFKNPLNLAVALACVKLILFLIAGNRYGYFRDELYFLASTDHIAFGYPDHAPLSIWIAKVSKSIFGESLYAIRLFPAIAGALKILMTGFLVREFGGKHIATLLACLAILVAPVYLSIDNLMGMNAYEPVFWMGCVLSYIWAVKKEKPTYWLLFGAIAGVGLMNKHSLLFFGIAMAIGFLLTKDRSAFARIHICFAALIALLLFLPNIIWQYQNDWATLELLRNVAETGKNVVNPPHVFFFQQILIHNPATLLIWIVGLFYLLTGQQLKEFRALGFAYLITLGLMMYFAAKHYYLSPAYPMLFAAGGVFWEKLLSPTRFGRVLLGALALLMLIAGALIAPMAIPLLPVEKVADYGRALGMPSTRTEVSHTSELPQTFSDQFGWKEMTKKVAEVYRSLPEDDRKKAAIFGENYGQAGAIDHFGKEYGLPKAISPHQSYYLWGPRDYDGSVIILLGVGIDQARRNCGKVDVGPEVNHPYAMPFERYRILVCRDLNEPLKELWPKIKMWR